MLICDSCDLGFHMACHSPALDTKPSGRWECFRCSPYQPSETAYLHGREMSSRNCQMSDSGISSQSSDLSTGSYSSHDSRQKLTNGSNPYTMSRTENKNLSSRHTKNGSSQLSPNNYNNKHQNRKSPSPNNSFKKSPSSMTKSFLPILPPHLHPHTGLLPDNWEDYQPDPDIPDVSKWDHHKIKEYFTSHGFSKDICQIFVEQVCNHIVSNGYKQYNIIKIYENWDYRLLSNYILFFL